MNTVQEIIKSIAWEAWKQVYIQNCDADGDFDSKKDHPYEWQWIYDGEFTTWWNSVSAKIAHTQLPVKGDTVDDAVKNVEERAKMIADQCKPCSSDFYSGIYQGVKIALSIKQP